MKKINYEKVKELFMQIMNNIKTYDYKTKITQFIKLCKIVKKYITRYSIILYKVIKWLTINTLIIIKYMIFGLVTIIYNIFFKAFGAIYDLFTKKQKPTQQNIGDILASVIVLFAISFLGYNVSANTVNQINNLFANSTLSQSEKDNTVNHVNHLKNTKNWNKADHQTTVLPNGDYMPNGVSYVEASPLKDSPLAKGTIKSTQYSNGKLKIINKLFTNPVNDDEVFINKITQGAQIAALSYGVNPSVLIAQAYVESGRGTSTLASKYNNYFGIKYKGTGSKVLMPTKEQTSDGTEYTINAYFQVYDNLADAMSANAELLRNGISGNTNRYSGAWTENTNSYADATKALTQNYATAVNYNTILNKFISTYGLYVLDQHPVHNPDLTKAN